MASTRGADQPTYSSDLGTLALCVLGAAGAFMSLAWLAYWIDPVSGTRSSCSAAGAPAAVEACLAGKTNTLLIQLGAVGLPGFILLTIGILMILKRPASH